MGLDFYNLTCGGGCCGGAGGSRQDDVGSLPCESESAACAQSPHTHGTRIHTLTCDTLLYVHTHTHTLFLTIGPSSLLPF